MRNALISVVAVVVVYGVAFGEIPQVISYQGRVVDTVGNPVVDGTYEMRFRIYNTPSGSTPLWDDTHPSVQVTDGVFNVVLGESPLDSIGLAFDEDYWLLVTVEGDDQTPRQRLGSVGYAYMASGLIPGTEVSGAVTSGTEAAIKGTNTATAGWIFGIAGETVSPSGDGVYGEATATTGPAYGGDFWSSSVNGGGVYGYASATTGYTCGGYFRSVSTSGRGVYGYASATTGVNFGLVGETYSTDGTGVSGWSWATTGNNVGVDGRTESTDGVGVKGWASATAGYTHGVSGASVSTDGYGVLGGAWATTGNTCGVSGMSASPDGRGVYGEASDTSGVNYGVYGLSESTSGYGVYGYASASTGPGVGVYGSANATDGYAGYFNGDVHVTGSINKSACSFIIDHPLDPGNRLLRHNCMESPEHLAVYRGKVRLGTDGEARVQMPEYFKALTKESKATIHLTAEGRPFITGYEWSADYGNFTAYGEPNRQVSWMVMAERDDPVIRQLARPVEEEKNPGNKFCDKGKFLHPIAYGYPESRGRNYEQHERERLRMEEERARREDERARMEEQRARAACERARMRMTEIADKP